ncbi:MAG: acyl-CoA/acyl-ACP dehydrogenase [Hyphomicrobiales bacterium]|nr:acyl-CoA/acyl-ACP dehydrogenase [Hyphomicrobiales bacterium]MDE2114732.1 acyl-CoA/acyl-ACP dehydrogenase [Hyphomicrobiales bacterium]
MLRERAERVAAIAALHADDVDANSRFPVEAMDAARHEKLLGAMVPVSLGGEGASVQDIVDACYILGQACSSAAMIFAMHHVKAACIVRHGQASAWHREFMCRMVQQQLLLASSTTEGQAGGDVRNSEAPVVYDGALISLERAATVLSYGAQADAIVTTARRAAGSLSSDQVLVVFDKADYTLSPTFSWQTLGMRGTCSGGFHMAAKGQAVQIMPQPYAEIHTQTMTPTAHLMWGGVWAGIAATAHERARLHLRKAARGAAQPPGGLVHLAKARTGLTTLRAMLQDMLNQFASIENNPAALSALDFQTAITLLKVDISEHAVASVMASLRACGLTGYREDCEASIGRQLRDILAAPVMINNDRIATNLGNSTLLVETPHNLQNH